MDLVSNGKKCTNCFRQQKGHPKPVGKKCIMQPILLEDDLIQAKKYEREKCLEKKRIRMATLENKEATKKRMALPKNKEANKKRMATENNKIADRKRKSTKIKKESQLERQKRLKIQRRSMFLARQRKKKSISFEGWCDPMETAKPEIMRLHIPNMDMVCSACDALMFPFETHRKNSDGEFTFSLCCGNGSFSLPNFKNPPQLLKDLLSSDSHESKEFRKNIISYILCCLWHPGI